MQPQKPVGRSPLRPRSVPGDEQLRHPQKRDEMKRRKKKSDVSWGQHLVCNDCLLRAFRQYEVTLEFSLVLFFISFSFLLSSLYVVED